MLLEFAPWFCASLVVSIIAALWLEAWLPLSGRAADYRHMVRNFTIWLLAFVLADYAVGLFWLDLPSFLDQQPYGLFYWLPPPEPWMTIAAGVVAMDLADYVYHRLAHRVPLLWRFHATHHSDLKLDVSTSLRTHPVELVLANFWRLGAALALGLPIWILAFREVLIFPLVFLQHADVKLPHFVENSLGRVLVTPAIHRVHHSVKRNEHDSNYGDGLILWDQLFGSFNRPITDPPERIGLEGYDLERHQTIHGMLLDPFRRRS